MAGGDWPACKQRECPVCVCVMNVLQCRHIETEQGTRPASSFFSFFLSFFLSGVGLEIEGPSAN